MKARMFLCWCWCLFLTWGALADTRANEAALERVRLGSNGWACIEGIGRSNAAVSLQASSNLREWVTLAVLDPRLRVPETSEVLGTNTAYRFVDTAAPEFHARFYRQFLSPITATNDWKNQARWPDDAFSSDPGSDGVGEGVRWLKFAILLEEPFRVYYQDSRSYLLHHDFASARLGPLRGMTRVQFDEVSLFHAGQKVLLGTILFAPDNGPAEFAIQFAGRDPYPREFVQRYFELVRTTVVAPANVAAFYFPSYEQGPTAALDESFFRTNGIRVSSVSRWLRGDQVYAAGWALGLLRFVPSGELEAASRDGRLRPEDILLTDAIPAEVPYVAGVVSLGPVTPNSHVAILARSYGVPFVWLAEAEGQARALALAGKEVVLQGALEDGSAQVQLFDVTGTLEPTLRAELQALKTPPTPQIVPKAHYGALSASTEVLHGDDARFFGGKAANYGLLRRTVPDAAPVAVAFSFDLWDAFMGQVMDSGKTLQAEITNRLARYHYPPDVSALSADLSAVRSLITKQARFDASLQAAVLASLASFEPNRNLRFRSSSNAEDGQTFSAAGLYDSYSGCVADELDGDDAGPCRCDPAESKERGAFRAIQKVYASFYNDNAFLERLRRGVDESQVGMGLLVHHSTPDEVEWANGVATVWTEAPLFGEGQLQATLVTQAGAISVANPNGLARPEIVDATEFGVSLTQGSSLVPVGASVMTWTSDYDALTELLFRVYREYVSAAGSTAALPTLDLEYKKVAPGNLLLKQVRPIPIPGTNAAGSYLLNEPTTYWPYQSESSDAFANHRLKCFLTLENRNLLLASSNLTQSLYTEARFDFREGTNLLSLTGDLASWPNAGHSFTNDPRRGLVTTDSWSVGTGSGERRFTLTSILPPKPDSSNPFIRQGEIRKRLSVSYGNGVPTLNGLEEPALVTSEEIQLVGCSGLSTFQAGSTEAFATTNGIQFEIAFLVSTNASGPPLGVDKNFWGTYPAALSPWMQTRIMGLTPEPLELKGYWSQSARAGHKYRYAWHVFEPELEEGLPARHREALRSANVQLLYVSRETWANGQVDVWILGFDGKFRRL